MQPPQVPKWMHFGSTRNGDFSSISIASASKYLDLAFFTLALITSPGIAPETITVLPSSVFPIETPFAPAAVKVIFSKIKFLDQFLAKSDLNN